MSINDLPAIKPRRQKFVTAHKEWEKYNNPQGWGSGQVQEHFHKRVQVLLELVHVQQPFRTLVRIIAARGS